MRLLTIGLAILIAVGGGAAIAHATRPPPPPATASQVTEIPPLFAGPTYAKCEKSGSLCNDKSWKCCAGLTCKAPNPKSPNHRICCSRGHC